MTHPEEIAALANLKVIDFSQGVAGPHIGMLLARQGADVVKVEPPQGDWSRVLGTQHGDSSAYSLNFNLGKRSIALDLKTREGLEVARDLVARADVVIEAFRPGVMRKLGLHYDAVAESNARVVYVSVSGYGQHGPRSSLPVTDGVIQGDSGLMALNRSRDRTPQRFPMVVVDVVTGIYGAQAVLAALLRRERTGRGAYIDCPLMQSALALQAPAILEHQFEQGLPDVLYVPLGVLKTLDGHMSLAVRTEAHFGSLCDVLDRPDLKTDARFANRLARVRHEEILMAELSRTFATRTSSELYQELVKVDVTSSIVRNYEEVLSDAESDAAGYFSSTHSSGGSADIRVPNIPGCTFDIGSKGSPSVGEHTRELLTEYGYSQQRIGDLLSAGAILEKRSR